MTHRTQRRRRWRIHIRRRWRIYIGRRWRIHIGRRWRIYIGRRWRIHIGRRWRIHIGRRWRIHVGRRWRIGPSDDFFGESSVNINGGGCRWRVTQAAVLVIAISDMRCEFCVPSDVLLKHQLEEKLNTSRQKVKGYSKQ